MKILTTGAVATSLFMSSLVPTTTLSYIELQSTDQLRYGTHISQELNLEGKSYDKFTNTSITYEASFDKSPEFIDTDVVVDGFNMTYEWVHNVDTSNWI